VCDKPIAPSRHRKYATIHDKCMEKYLEAFDSTSADEFNKNIDTTILPKK
tara:strand:- start:872 stop:1021 length:150 start_codon:yes stop_codon:yes gene_type:complete